MRRLAFSVYVFAVAIIAVIALGGYTYYTDRQNDEAITALAVERQAAINEFLRDQVCARFELRDEINIAILDEGRRRAVAAGRTDVVQTYDLFIAAIQNAQGNCVQEIPGVRRK